MDEYEGPNTNYFFFVLKKDSLFQVTCFTVFERSVVDSVDSEIL